MKSMIIPLVLLCWACTRTDTEENTRGLLQADRDFSALSMEQGMNKAFLEYASEDAVLLRENAMPLVGKDLLARSFENRPDTAFSLSWEPLYGRVAESGDMGYTYGKYQSRNRDGLLLGEGTYCSIWIREEGTWRWVLDTGNQGLGKKE